MASLWAVPGRKEGHVHTQYLLLVWSTEHSNIESLYLEPDGTNKSPWFIYLKVHTIRGKQARAIPSLWNVLQKDEMPLAPSLPWRFIRSMHNLLQKSSRWQLISLPSISILLSMKNSFTVWAATGCREWEGKINMTCRGFCEAQENVIGSGDVFLNHMLL